MDQRLVEQRPENSSPREPGRVVPPERSTERLLQGELRRQFLVQVDRRVEQNRSQHDKRDESSPNHRRSVEFGEGGPRRLRDRPQRNHLSMEREALYTVEGVLQRAQFHPATLPRADRGRFDQTLRLDIGQWHVRENRFRG